MNSRRTLLFRACRVVVRTRIQPTSRRTRYGTAATEFALLLPLVLLLALATCDLGRIVHAHVVVSQAARTGAEVGAVQQFTSYTRTTWEDDIRQAVIDEISNLPNFDLADLQYELSVELDADDIPLVGVEVAYPFRSVVSWPLLPTEVLLRERIDFRQFR